MGASGSGFNRRGVEPWASFARAAAIFAHAHSGLGSSDDDALFRTILLPTLTAAENVALPLLLDGKSRGASLHEAHLSLESVGMSHRAGHLPEEM